MGLLGLDDAHLAVRIAGAIVALGATFGYTQARSKLKIQQTLAVSDATVEAVGALVTEARKRRDERTTDSTPA